MIEKELCVNESVYVDVLTPLGQLNIPGRPGGPGGPGGPLEELMKKRREKRKRGGDIFKQVFSD